MTGFSKKVVDEHTREIAASLKAVSQNNSKDLSIYHFSFS